MALSPSVFFVRSVPIPRSGYATRYVLSTRRKRRAPVLNSSRFSLIKPRDCHWPLLLVSRDKHPRRLVEQNVPFFILPPWPQDPYLFLPIASSNLLRARFKTCQPHLWRQAPTRQFRVPISQLQFAAAMPAPSEAVLEHALRGSRT